jgi:type I restriction enzyme R subunit
MAVAYTDKINELLSGFEASQVLAEVGKTDQITAEVNISVSDSKDEDPAMRPFRLSETEEDDQKRRFLTPDDPLCFLVVTAKLMTGFDAPNEGVLYLDKPLKAHTLFQTITCPNRTWVSPGGFVKSSGVVVDYVGLAEEVQRAVVDLPRRRPTREAGLSTTCPSSSTNSAPPSPASKTSLSMWTAWTSRSTDSSQCGPLTSSWRLTPAPLRRLPGTTDSWPACTHS